jgi:signal transduction histidine kinase
LSVEDEGEGIDPSNSSRIFDPFYSTRFLGRGLGLPLVLMHTKRMHGLVQVHSTPHVGTRARLLFAELPELDA